MNNKSTRKPLTAILIIAACFVVGFSAGLLLGNRHKLKDGEHIITVCATTDVHGAYFDAAYTEGEHNESSLSRVSTYIRKLRKEGKNPVLIDVGDALQGDNASYYYNYVDTTDEHVFASIAKYLKYDALVVGNHDIEAGPAVYNRMLKTFPKSYLAANVYRTEGDDRGACYFQRCRIIKRDGLKIAIIGMTNGNIKNWLSEDKWKGMQFENISSMTQFVVENVHKYYKPDLVILAVHSGMGNDFPAIENEALYTARTTIGVDLVICGHDHKADIKVTATNSGDVTPVLDAGTKAANVAVAELKAIVVKHKVTSVTSRQEIVSMADYEPDPKYDRKFSKQYRKVYEFANKAVGAIDGDIDFEEGPKGPSACVNLVQTVQMKASGADISFAAPLTISGKVNKGSIAFKDLAKIYRFENQLYVIRMTGAQIRDYLEFSYDNWVNQSGPAFNFDSADGIIYEVSRSAAKGSRVRIISMCDGTPFDLEKTYNVAMTSYRASGGGYLLRDGAGMDPRKIEIVEKMGDIREIIGDYLREQGTVTPSVPTNWKWVD